MFLSNNVREVNKLGITLTIFQLAALVFKIVVPFFFLMGAWFLWREGRMVRAVAMLALTIAAGLLLLMPLGRIGLITQGILIAVIALIFSPFLWAWRKKRKSQPTPTHERIK